MSYIKAIDVSRYQGLIDWQAVKDSGVEIGIIKMSGGDDGLYLDPRANGNYYGAQRAGLALGMYHFAGGTDAVAEADYFVNACSPLAENDVLVLDWEVQHPDPIGWCLSFVNRIHDRTGTYPLLYLNGSTWNAYDWTPVTSLCGVYVAWYDRDPEANLPVPGVYVMHQYTSTGSVPGITGYVDLDAWFGTVDQFKAYGYHAAPTTPAVVTPEPAPVPVVTPEPVVAPVVIPVPEVAPVEPVVATPDPVTPVEVPTPIVIDSPLAVDTNTKVNLIIKLLTSIKMMLVRLFGVVKKG